MLLVHTSAPDLDWQMTILFPLAVALLGFVMKLAALLVPGAPCKTRWAFVLSPLPSPDSIGRSPAHASRLVSLGRLALLGAALVLYYWLYWYLVRRFGLRGPVLGYLAAPFLWLLAETLNAFLSLVTGGALPSLLNHPPLARGVADFWGRRWNLWFSDWFRYTLFVPLRRRPVVALLVVFAISGLMHEWAVNLPLFFVTGRAPFGSMMLYFLIQPAGLLIERRLLKRHPVARIVLAWWVVVGPVPLLINEGMLRAFHLWPG